MLTVADLLDGADATDAGIARVFERVRDIPFAFTAHNEADTLLACGAGTCAPKHALLARLYGELGLETRFVYVAFRFDDMPGWFPPALRAELDDGVLRGHAALRVLRPHGWIDVDATFDEPLAAAGFIVTRGWDGRASRPLVVNPESRVESHLPPEHEEQLLGITQRTSLPRRFVEELNAWLQTVRAGCLHADRWALRR